MNVRHPKPSGRGDFAVGCPADSAPNAKARRQRAGKSQRGDKLRSNSFSVLLATVNTFEHSAHSDPLQLRACHRFAQRCVRYHS
jgi:hypothetical protein